MRGVYKTVEAEQLAHARYRECLSHWPVPCEQRTVPSSQGETFVVSCGPQGAPAVILLHGTMATSAVWVREARRLAERFRVHAIDLIGDGGFSAPARPPLDTDAHAVWLAEVIDALGVQSASLVGVSFGGGIALDFAIRQPERVASLVLLTPAGVANRNILWWALLFLMCGGWGARKVTERIMGALREPQTEETERLGQLSNALFRGMRPRTGAPGPFTDAQLARLNMPVLALLGEHDVTVDTPKAAKRLNDAVANVQVRVVEGAGHYLGDQSEQIREFIAANASESGSG